jgi:Flp pilus assembly protein TadG
MPRWRCWTTGEPGVGRMSDDGSASLEFITAGMILLVPLVYLILAMSVVQGGALAVEGAARQAARVYVQAPDDAEGRARAARAVEFSLADYGIGAGGADVQIDCDDATTECLSRQAHVTVTVHISVGLPLVPDVLALQRAVSIPLQASATQTVSRFWGTGK